MNMKLIKKKNLDFDFSVSIKYQETMKNFVGQIFWGIDYDGNYSLYKIENDFPSKLTNLPKISYPNSKKAAHMKEFFIKNKINFTPHNQDIQNDFIFSDPDVKSEYKKITAPLYEVDKYECEFKFISSSYKGLYPTSNMVMAAQIYAQKIYKLITEEDILYDFRNLSLDGGICAFFEEYHIAASLHLPTNRFFVFELQMNPNTENEPLIEYSKTYLNDLDPMLPRHMNFVVFDKQKIAEIQKNTYCIDAKLPRKVASLVIGNRGENMPKLLYNLGIPRINFNKDEKNPIKAS